MAELTISVAASGDDGFVACEENPTVAWPPDGTPITTTGANTDFALMVRKYRTGFSEASVGFIRFDTSVIPDDATITAATLRLYVSARGANGRDVKIAYYAGSNWPLDTSDYSISDTPSGDAATVALATFVDETSVDVALSNLSSIDKSGYTGFRLEVDGGDPGATDYRVQFAEYDHATKAEPQLIITYTVPVTGTAAQDFPALTQDASGSALVDGSAASALPGLTQAADGALMVDGTADSALPALTQAADGTVAIAGVAGPIAQTFPALEQAASGSALVDGSAASGLPGLSQSASGALTITGEAGGTLGALATAAGGTLTVAGDGTQTLPALGQSAAGLLPVVGTIDATLPALATSLDGELGRTLVALALSAAHRHALALEAGAASGITLAAAHARNLDLEAVLP